MENKTKKIIFVGAAYPYRGGIASFTERMALEYQQLGYDVSIYTFTLQYPNFLFPGKTQYSDVPPAHHIPIYQTVNTINPLSWINTALRIRKQNPEIIFYKFWMPFFAPAFGTIARIASWGRKTKIVCIADNIIPHERRVGDIFLTKYFLEKINGVVCMSKKVAADLLKLAPSKKYILTPHPLYDNYGEMLSKEAACDFLKIDKNQKVILFFGFIRKYKGLDMLLKAFSDKRFQNGEYTLVIAGEFYEDEKPYREIIEQHTLKDKIVLCNDFIPDDKVRYYMCAADVLVQPYYNATQSGVTPLAYYFELPGVVTNVGGLTENFEDKKAGLVAEPTIEDIADKLIQFFKEDRVRFIEHIRSEKEKYSWKTFIQKILDLVHDI